MRLAEFIRANHEEIIAEWESFARSLLTREWKDSPSVLRDHAEEILGAIADDMSSFQSAEDQTQKSRGRGRDFLVGGAGRLHAVFRIERGFSLDQLVAEYRALRASVLRLWAATGEANDVDGVTRFNEAIDEALTQSTTRFVELIERHRGESLGILGHDLRNPLNAIMMGASMLTTADGVDDAGARVAGRILSSAKRMERMVKDLLDLTRARLGGGIPIFTKEIDLEDVCRQVVAELETCHPDEALRFACHGDLHGEWDGDRLAQVVSNLLGNAIQHGTREGPVTLDVRDEGGEVVLEVHNEGPPISRDALGTIFEPMVSSGCGEEATTANSLGLGLYIAREVVTAHGGNIDVTSTKPGGTTFRVHLPRHLQGRSARPLRSHRMRRRASRPRRPAAH